MQVIICEACHDMHCFKLTKCIQQFCLDLAPVIKSLCLQSHLALWTNKDHAANLLSTEGVEKRVILFLGQKFR